jgi:hypothetical protein
MKEDTGSENKIKKVLFNEVSFVLALIGIIVGFISWVTNPTNVLSQRVGTLENTMEFQTQTLTEIKEKVEIIEDRQIEILQAIARLQADHD